MPGRTRRGQLSCRAVGRALQAYIDDELADERGPLIANHLDACLRCGMDAASFRWLKARLAGLAPGPTDHELNRLRAFADGLA